MGAVAIEQPVKTNRINKQRVREGVATAVRLSRQVFDATRESRVLVTLVLVAVLTLSSIGVVVSARAAGHCTRAFDVTAGSELKPTITIRGN